MQVDGRRLVRAMRRAGFTIVRQGGDRLVTVPVHDSKDIRPGTLRSILEQAGMTEDELRSYL